LTPAIANHKDTYDWLDLRRLGAGFWLNLGNSRLQFEQLAKNRFKKASDPMAAVLFYVALKK
jgi:hypothetical protein